MTRNPKAGPPAVGINPNIPLPVQRDLRKVAAFAFDAQSKAEAAQATASSKFGKEDLLDIATAVRAEFQPGGNVPFSITGLPGQAGQPQIAGIPTLSNLPVAGVYNQINTAVLVNGVLYVYQQPVGSPATPPAWAPVTAVVIEDTHANRLANYPASSYAKGTVFYETDREVWYLITIPTGTTHVWRYAAGMMNATYVNIPTDLTGPPSSTTEDDRDFLLWNVTYNMLYIWHIAGWQIAAGTYENTFSNRPTLGTGDANFQFHASDYNVLERWTGSTWEFISGSMTGPFSDLASIGALFGTEEAGFTFSDTTYQHEWIWTGGAWKLIGESGYIVMSPNGSAPTSGVWYACDGGSYTVVTGTGGTTSVTTPNLNNGVGVNNEPALLMSGGFAALSPATSPTWISGAKTETENSHTHQVTVTDNIDVTIAGITTDAVGTQTVTSGAGTAHQHNLTNSDAQLNPPGVANGGLAQYYGTSWFMRA